MATSTFTLKCGSKRRNHQCGLGLCSTQAEYQDGVLSKIRKLRSDSKLLAVPQIDVDTDSNLDNPICKKCSKCARPINGHPLPKGKKCNLEPHPMIETIQLEQHAEKMEKDRKRKKSPKVLEQARKRNKSDAAKAKARERKKSEAAKTKARERNKSKTAMTKSKIRSLKATKYRKKIKEYFGWSNINEKNSVERHILPNMTDICSDCGASMFPWERSKMKNNGDKTFSLCCSYGSIKLTPFRDPSPQLKNLFENSTSQSKQFLANIRKYNGLVAMSSKCISGKLTDFSKFKSRGPNIYKMSGQMYHLIPNVFPVEGKVSKFSQIYVYDNECEENELDESTDEQY